MKTKVILLLLLFTGLSGCNPAGEMLSAVKKANETNAFSVLKMISVSQNIHLMEHEKYAATIHELDKQGYGSEKTMKLLLSALHRSSQKAPFSGYYFADIEEDESGGPLDTQARYGLTAYPANPGTSGDVMIILLMDSRTARFTEDRAGMGDEVQFWTAPYKKADLPVTRWPSSNEFDKKFSRVKMRSPAEALEEAKKQQGR